MKVLILSILFCFINNAFTKEYEQILDCSQKEVDLKIIVTRELDTYFLEINEQRLELYIERADMGYLGFELLEKSALNQLVNILDNFSILYIYNNEEDINEGETAMLTHGTIYFGQDQEIECSILGRFEYN